VFEGLTAEQQASPVWRLYSAMLGLTLNLATGLQRMEDLGFGGEELVVAGGTAKSGVWRQMLADVTGKPVRQNTTSPELLAPRGAAVYALWCWLRKEGHADLALSELAEHFIEQGDVTLPNPDNAGAYRDAMRRFRELRQRVYGV